MLSEESKRVAIIKIGGSFATDHLGVNESYLIDFFGQLNQFLTQHFSHAVFVIGGGDPARTEQQLLRDQGVTDTKVLDQAGIRVTRRHAAAMAEIGRQQGLDIEYQPIDSVRALKSTIWAITKDSTAHFALALGGLVPGQSTDAVAVEAAQAYEAQGFEPAIVILSNIAAILDKAPSRVLSADEQLAQENPPQAIKTAGIDFLVAIGALADHFEPGQKTPIDSTAVGVFKKMIEENPNLAVLFTAGDMLPDILWFLADPEMASPAMGTKIVGDGVSLVEYHSRLRTREILKKFQNKLATNELS
jgi:uridylate kinase